MFTPTKIIFAVVMVVVVLIILSFGRRAYESYMNPPVGPGSEPVCGVDGNTYAAYQIQEKNIAVACYGTCPCN